MIESWDRYSHQHSTLANIYIFFIIVIFVINYLLLWKTPFNVLEIFNEYGTAYQQLTISLWHPPALLSVRVFLLWHYFFLKGNSQYVSFISFLNWLHPCSKTKTVYKAGFWCLCLYCKQTSFFLFLRTVRKYTRLSLKR